MGANRQGLSVPGRARCAGLFALSPPPTSRRFASEPTSPSRGREENFLAFTSQFLPRIGGGGPPRSGAGGGLQDKASAKRCPLPGRKLKPSAGSRCRSLHLWRRRQKNTLLTPAPPPFRELPFCRWAPLRLAIGYRTGDPCHPAINPRPVTSTRQPSPAPVRRRATLVTVQGPRRASPSSSRPMAAR